MSFSYHNTFPDYYLKIFHTATLVKTFYSVETCIAGVCGYFYESALHVAIKEEAPIEMIDSLLTTYPEDIHNRDQRGKLSQK